VVATTLPPRSVLWCLIRFSEQKYLTVTQGQLSTHHEQVIVRTCSPEALKMLALRQEVQKHELTPFYVTTVVLPSG
jgi:hypothetical protein